MINNIQNLTEYLDADFTVNSVNCSKKYLLLEPILALFGSVRESFYVRKYLRILRKYEYYINAGNHLKMLYYGAIWKRLSNKYQIYIHPNTVGKGLYIPHFHGGIQLNCLSMGDYCTVSAGVIVGNKGSQENRATIGNNVELTIGCKIIGKIKIGDNAVVCPNSVVIKDVPANTIVSGIPAQIVKIKECQ